MELWTYSSTLLMLIYLKVLLGAGRTDNVMKTKALFLSIVALLMSATLSAQTIIKGDMNDDKQVSIADVTSLVNVILGKAPMETLSVECEPYKVDNSLVVGTWYAPDGTSFMFNADGTTTFPDGATYEFMPLQGRLLLYDDANKPVKVLPILKAESEFLLTVDYATSLFTYYTKSNPVEPQEEKLYWYFGTTKLITDEEIKANGTHISSKDEIPNSLNLVDPEETLFYYFYWPKSFGTPTLTFNGLPASGKSVEELSNMKLTDYTGWRFSKGSTGEHNITW